MGERLECLGDLSWDLIVMQLFFGLALGSVYVLLASGLSIIYGLLDVVNFAHGTFAMLGAYAVFLAVTLTGSFAVGIASAVVVVAILGMVTEFVLLKPLYGKDPLLPLLLTFGLSVAIPDFMKVIFGLIGKPVSYPEALSGSTTLGLLTFSNYRLFVIFFTMAILISLWLFLKKSDLGMIIRAATRDRLDGTGAGHQHLAHLVDRFCTRHRPGGARRGHFRSNDGGDAGHGG